MRLLGVGPSRGRYQHPSVNRTIQSRFVRDPGAAPGQTAATRRYPATESNRAASLCKSAVFASSLTGRVMGSRSGGDRTLANAVMGRASLPWVAAWEREPCRTGLAERMRLGWETKSTLPAARLLGVEPR